MTERTQQNCYAMLCVCAFPNLFRSHFVVSLPRKPLRATRHVSDDGCWFRYATLNTFTTRTATAVNCLKLYSLRTIFTSLTRRKFFSKQITI
jgi:hypothetical protein